MFALTISTFTRGLGQEHAEEPIEARMEHHFAIKELDSLHDILHPLVDDALPDKDYEAIRNQLDKYLSTPLAIDKASLPEEYASRDKEFKELSTLLISEINNLHEMGAKPDEEMFEAKFEEMHETFETLAHMLM